MYNMFRIGAEIFGNHKVRIQNFIASSPFLVRQIFFLKIGMATLQRYPMGKKFRQNHSI